MGEDRLIPYELIRSDRKTISLRITEAGGVLVRAPKRCPRSYIDQFVQSKSAWIQSRQEQVQAALTTRQEFRLKTGDILLFCGRPFRVQLTEERRGSLDLERKPLRFPTYRFRSFRRWCSGFTVAAAFTGSRSGSVTGRRQMNVTFGKVNLSSAVRRWASCSANGDIHVSWLLLFAPAEAIDYVLIHELCHRVEFNHSPAFWRMVARYKPDYPEQKQVLQQLHERLYAQGWRQK